MAIGWLSVFLPAAGPLRIEALDAGDAAAVAGLHAAGGFARSWPADECAALLADASVSADGLRKGGSGRLAGFVASRIAADEAEILSFVVAPARRRGGHGRQLLAAHREALVRRGVARLLLEVEEANAAAVALYRRDGFVQVGRREGYYPTAAGGRAAALVLRRDLA